MPSEIHIEPEEIVRAVEGPVDAFLDTLGTHVPVSIPPEPKPPTFTTAEVNRQLVNDSLGTVDPADATDTDPKDDPAGDQGTGARENA